jgi:hypothetical protein
MHGLQLQKIAIWTGAENGGNDQVDSGRNTGGLDFRITAAGVFADAGRCRYIPGAGS